MPPIRCTLEISSDDKRLLRLIYTADGRWDFEHRGVRWWFSCPHMADGEQCGRRVGKLYRRPDGRHFACRHCLELTYESCRNSHRYDRLFALMAGEASGEAFEAVKRAFSYQAKEARKRRTTSPPSLLDAFERAFDEAKRSPEYASLPFIKTRRTRR